MIAALASFLSARKSRGRWLLRIEDLDQPRVVPGATDSILKALDVYQLHWDGPVLYQSSRLHRYGAALRGLGAGGRVYACACSRRQISAVARRGPAGYLYPGTCRSAGLAFESHAIRLQTEGARVRFQDRILGTQDQDLEHEVGDFVLRRADGIFAYQLAVVVDDADQGVTEVVRGHDILDSTGRQIYLHQLLELRTPSYAHLPVAVDKLGRKLSKMSGARAISADAAGATLWQALEFLGQQPPSALRQANPGEIVAWAMGHWDESRVPTRASVVTPDFA